MSGKKTLEELIVEGCIDDAINELLSNATSTSQRSILLKIKSRYNTFTSSKISGTLSYADESVEYNKIINSILLAAGYERSKNEIDLTTKKSKLKMSLIIIMIAVIFSLFHYFTNSLENATADENLNDGQVVQPQNAIVGDSIAPIFLNQRTNGSNSPTVNIHRGNATLNFSQQSDSLQPIK